MVHVIERLDKKIKGADIIIENFCLILNEWGCNDITSERFYFTDYENGTYQSV